jgi:hypothetical protein
MVVQYLMTTSEENEYLYTWRVKEEVSLHSWG